MKATTRHPLICFIIFTLYSLNYSDMAGVTVPYDGTSSVGSLDSACNMNCDCSNTGFNPVCGSDGVTYYSSCHAGCQDHSDNMVCNVTLLSVDPASNTSQKHSDTLNTSKFCVLCVLGGINNLN